VLFGLYVGTAAILGFSLAPLGKLTRWLYGILALGIVLPPAAFAAAPYVNYAAIALSVAAIALEYMRRAANGRAQAAAKA
jgi:hypothetical protein